MILAGFVLLFFGAKKLPELGRSVGESVHELKKGFSGDASQPSKPVEKTDAKE